uniref:Ovule protein n=1 Tax=Ascaris lumbricoides TaxID=6252 RepID=A0A0M3HP64_ASCLU
MGSLFTSREAVRDMLMRSLDKNICWYCCCHYLIVWAAYGSADLFRRVMADPRVLLSELTVAVLCNSLLRGSVVSTFLAHFEITNDTY